MTFVRDSEGRPVETIGVTRDISERKLKERQLEYASLHDPLTGFYNRIYFNRRFAGAKVA
ncbi:MAG: GGDEF domain-containing protein [Bacillota bacterium]